MVNALPKQHTPNVEKVSRFMAAWQWGVDELPADIEAFVFTLPSGDAVLISPRAGTAHGPGTRAGIVLTQGWWIIQAETGCLYAVSDADFRKKYRRLGNFGPLTNLSRALVAEYRADCERRNGREH